MCTEWILQFNCPQRRREAFCFLFLKGTKWSRIINYERVMCTPYPLFFGKPSLRMRPIFCQFFEHVCQRLKISLFLEMFIIKETVNWMFLKNQLRNVSLDEDERSMFTRCGGTVVCTTRTPFSLSGQGTQGQLE